MIVDVCLFCLPLGIYVRAKPVRLTRQLFVRSVESGILLLHSLHVLDPTCLCNQG